METTYQKSKRTSTNAAKYPVEEMFEDFTSPFCSYVLGLYFADGNLRKTGHTISLSLVEDDVELLEKIRDRVQPTKPLHYCNVKGGRNQYKLAISNVDIANAFRSMGMTPNKSTSLKPPVGDVSRRDFIRGYVDGDGHISRKDFSILGTPELLEWILSCFEEVLGHPVKVRMYHKKGTSTQTISMHVSDLDERKKLLYWLYENNEITLKRKELAYKTNY